MHSNALSPQLRCMYLHARAKNSIWKNGKNRIKPPSSPFLISSSTNSPTRRFGRKVRKRIAPETIKKKAVAKKTAKKKTTAKKKAAKKTTAKTGAVTKKKATKSPTRKSASKKPAKAS